MTPAMLLPMKKSLELGTQSMPTSRLSYIVGLFGLLRKANMLLKGVAKFNLLKNLRRGANVFFTVGLVIIVNRCSKTIHFSQRVLTIPLPHIPGHPLCPYTALLHASSLFRPPCLV